MRRSESPTARSRRPSRRSSPRARRRWSAPRGCSTCCATPASSMPVPPGCSSSPAARSQGCGARRSRLRSRPSLGRSGSRRCTSSSHGTATARRFSSRARTSTARRLEQALLEMGDCLLVVGEAPLVKVHVHTDDPGEAISVAVVMGAIDRVAIANMHVQTEERERRLAGERHLTRPPGRPFERRAHDRREHRDRARLDGRHARSRRRAADLALRAAHRPLRRRAVPRRGRHRRGGVLRPPARRRGTPVDGGPVARARTPPSFEELADFAHILVLPVSSQVSASAPGGTDRGRHARGRRPCHRPRRAHGIGRHGAPGAGRPAPARRRHGHGRGHGLVHRGPRPRLGADLRGHARVPAPRRPDRAHVGGASAARSACGRC